MADKTIDQLTELTTLEANDLLIAYDVSELGTEKIRRITKTNAFAGIDVGDVTTAQLVTTSGVLNDKISAKASLESPTFTTQISTPKVVGNSTGLYLQEDGGKGIFIKDGGNNIGIGTDTPTVGWGVDVANGGVRVMTGGSNQIRFGRKTTSVGYGEVVADANGIRIAVSSDESTFTTGIQIDQNAKVGIGTASPSTKLEVQGSTSLQGTIKMGPMLSYSKSISNSTASPVGYSLLRQFYADNSWCQGGVLVEELVFYYATTTYDYGMHFAKAGYTHGSQSIATKISGGIAPVWGTGSLISGNDYYIDLSISVPAYYQVAVKMTFCNPVTTNSSAGGQTNYIYLY